jgi:hypothetical protein
VPDGESFKIVVENNGVSPTKRSATSTAVEDKEQSPMKRSVSSTKKVRMKEAEFTQQVRKNISMETAKAVMTVMHAKKILQTRLYSKELASGSKAKKAEIILRHEMVADTAVEVLKQWMGDGKKDEEIVLIIMNILGIGSDRAEDMVGVAKGRVWEELQPILTQIQIRKEVTVVDDQEIIAEEAKVPATPTPTPVLPPATPTPTPVLPLAKEAAELPVSKSKSGDDKTRQQEKEELSARMLALTARIESDKKTLAATKLTVEAAEKRDAEARVEEEAKASEPTIGVHKKREKEKLMQEFKMFKEYMKMKEAQENEEAAGEVKN